MAKKNPLKEEELTKKKPKFRNPKPFRRKVFRRNPALTTQKPRSLGGHR